MTMRVYSIALAMLLVALCLSTVPAAAAGGELVFDVQPVTLEGRTLVPVRPIFEWLGAKVDYDSGHLSAYRSAEALVPAVELWLGSTEAKVAGASYELDVAPQLISDRLFVPLRFVAESFGVWVEAQGRQMVLSLPQEDIEAVMAIPPHPQSLLGKMWVVASGYYGLIDGAAEPEGRRVEGIRVLDSRVDAGAGTGWMHVRVVYEDDEAVTDHFHCVLQPSGWQIEDVQTDEVPAVTPTDQE